MNFQSWNIVVTKKQQPIYNIESISNDKFGSLGGLGGSQTLKMYYWVYKGFAHQSQKIYGEGTGSPKFVIRFDDGDSK